MTQHHPDFAAEQVHLSATIDGMNQIINDLRHDVSGRSQKITDSLTVKDEISAYVHALMRDDHSAQIYDIESALPSPYFGRVDFRDDHGGDFESFYIGRVKIAHPDSTADGNILVFDWRDPVSTIFYECHDGRANYDVLDRYHYSGDVRLKRQYKIERSQLKQIVDDYILDQVLSRQEQALFADPLLRERLLAGAGDKLKDIVVSIQAEQNKIIRETLNQVMVIQGVAGSGKSTVGLHRLSYLLYNEKLDPQKLIVIAPNKIFLDYISELLPTIHAADVRQAVWHDLAAEITQHTWPMYSENRLAILLSKDKGQEQAKNRLLLTAKLKGSQHMLTILDAYIDRKTEQFCLKLEPITLFDDQLSISRQQLIDKFLEDHRSPYNVRLQSLMGYVRFRIRNFLEVHEARKNRSKKTDLVLENYRKESDTFLEKRFTRWKQLDLFAAYQDLYKSKRHFKAAGFKKEELSAVTDHTMSVLSASQIESEDLAPLCYLKYLLDGWQHMPKFNHIVVDEAQDMNALEFSMLRKLSANQSFTIMGDLSQGIHSYRSIDSWQTLLKEVFSDTRTIYREILYSYRSAKEIVDLFNKVMPPGSSRALPVYEAGRNPVIERVSSLTATADRIAELLAAPELASHRTIGIITKLEADSIALHEHLSMVVPPELSLHLLTSQAKSYQGGISILPVTLAKGLEFDAVIIANASAAEYGPGAFDARLLYVALSRAMHSLYILYQGTLTKLLR